MNLKKIIKQCIDTNPKLNIKKIKKDINKYDYVSFDIFDTLIKRDVENPNNVFDLVSSIFFKNKTNTFKIDRINAEKVAKINSETEEITISDIYNILIKKYNYKKDEANKLKELEIEVEKNICAKNEDVFELYNYCKLKNKKVLIVSNMYLDENIIKEILQKNGYEYYRLYLSSTIGKKKNGSLFSYILNDLNISTKDMIHIGDSYKNDFFSAKKYGIKAIRIPKKIIKINHYEKKNFIKEDKFISASIDCFINNRIKSSSDEYYKFGYQSFGMLIYGFNKYMHDDLEKKGIKDIFFFSRDGYIIKKIYDEMYPNDKIKSHYIYVSRRSLRVPQLWTKPELENVINTFPLAKILTMDTFIKNLGLNPNDYSEILKKYNMNLKTNITKKEILINKNIIGFYNEIKSDVIDHSKEECNLLLEYFKQEGFKGKIAVVDIGWHASLQYFIQNLVTEFNYPVDMEGYYIGLAKEAKKGIKTNGYVIDFDSTTNSCDSWKAFNGLVETLFLAQEGSTKKFEIKNGKISPVLYKYEYEKNNGEKESEAKYVYSLQQGALDFVKDFKISLLSTIKYSSFTAFRKIYLTGIYPNKKDINMFSDFRFLEEQIDYLAKPLKLYKYFLNPKKLKKDLFLSRWKIGFMKKLLKIKLPYIKFYKILRKISG